MKKIFSADRVGKLFNGTSPLGLIHFFLLPTFAYGIGFTFFGSTSQVTYSSLHRIMVDQHDLVPMAWGIVLCLVGLACLNTMILKVWYIGHTAAFVGFTAWLFASIMYTLDLQYMLVFAVTLPSMLFWLWLYFRIKQDKSTVHYFPPKHSTRKH